MSVLERHFRARLRRVTGTVSVDDPAYVPLELGEDESTDIESIDHCIDAALDGAAVAFGFGRGWRRRASRVDYWPYR